MYEKEVARRFAIDAFTRGAFKPFRATAEWDDYGNRLKWEIDLPAPSEPVCGTTALKQPEDILSIVRELRRDLERDGVTLDTWQEPALPKK